MYRIGDWLFDPASAELRRGGERKRVEHRAARTLELLCQAPGEMVSHERIIERVWDGRIISENSVSVVISQLRRALGDDPREPRLIQTIPKRGYRLIGATAAKPQSRRIPLVSTALVAVAALLFGWFLLAERGGHQRIAVADVSNETGDPAHDPLARATSELLVTELSGRGYRVVRSGSAPLRMNPRLVMWDGAPALGLSLLGDSDAVVWSGMTNGSASKVPRGLAAELDEMQSVVPPDGSSDG